MLIITCFTPLVKTGLGDEGKRDLNNSGRKAIQTLNSFPVSYTHLDVYKRQVLYSLPTR